MFAFEVESGADVSLEEGRKIAGGELDLEASKREAELSFEAEPSLLLRASLHSKLTLSQTYVAARRWEEGKSGWDESSRARENARMSDLQALDLLLGRQVRVVTV